MLVQTGMRSNVRALEVSIDQLDVQIETLIRNQAVTGRDLMQQIGGLERARETLVAEFSAAQSALSEQEELLEGESEGVGWNEDSTHCR